jgi:hypothetical protein
VKTGCNLAESSKEGYGSSRAVLPMMMKNDFQNNLSSIYVTSSFACCQVLPHADYTVYNTVQTQTLTQFCSLNWRRSGLPNSINYSQPAEFTLYLHILLFKTHANIVLSSTPTYYATSRKVADSSPDEVDFFNLPNSSSRNMALGLTQPLTEMSTRNLPGG